MPSSKRTTGAGVAAGMAVALGVGGIGVGGAGTGVAVGGTGVGVGGTGVGVSEGTGVAVLGIFGVLVGSGVLAGKIGVSVGTWVAVGGKGVCVKVGCGTRVGSGRGTRASRGPQPQLRDATSRAIGTAMRAPARKCPTRSITGWMLNNGQSPCLV